MYEKLETDERDILAGQGDQRFSEVSKTGDESPVVSHEPQKLSNTLKAVGDRPRLNIFYLLGVALESTSANDMA